MLESAMVNVNVTGNEKLTSGSLTGNIPLQIASASTYADGAGANQAQRIGGKSNANLLAAAPDVVDLTAVPSPIGNVNFTGVKEFVLVNTGTQMVTIGGNNGGAVTNVWTGMLKDATDKIDVPPGGKLVLSAPTAAGLPVSGASKNLVIAAGADGAKYDLTLIGKTS